MQQNQKLILFRRGFFFSFNYLPAFFGTLLIFVSLHFSVFRGFLDSSQFLSF